MKLSHIPLASFAALGILITLSAPALAAPTSVAVTVSGLQSVTEAYPNQMVLNVVDPSTGQAVPSWVELVNSPASGADTDYYVDYAVGSSPPAYGMPGWTDLGPGAAGPAFWIDGPTTVSVMTYDNEAQGDPDGNDTGQGIGVEVAPGQSGSSPGTFTLATTIPVVPATLTASPSTIAPSVSTAVTFTLKDASGHPLSGFSVQPETASSPTGVTNAQGRVTLQLSAPAGLMTFWAEDTVDNGQNMAGITYAGAYATAVVTIKTPAVTPPPTPTVPTVLLARSDLPYDGLVGSVLAVHDKIPLLLTTPGSLTLATRQTLQADHTTHVVVLGGPVAVSAGVLSTLEGMGITVTRVAGLDRYGTAAAIFRTVGDASGTVMLTNGDAFPNLMSIAALAGAQGWPVLLTHNGSIPPVEAPLFSGYGIRTVYVVGSPSSVSQSTMAWLTQRGLSVIRVDNASGLTGSYATEAAVMARFRSVLKFTTLYVTGPGFLAGLQATPTVAEKGSMVIEMPSALPVAPELSQVLRGLTGTVIEVSPLSGSGIPTSVANWLGHTLAIPQ